MTAKAQCRRVRAALTDILVQDTPMDVNEIANGRDCCAVSYARTYFGRVARCVPGTEQGWGSWDLDTDPREATRGLVEEGPFGGWLRRQKPELIVGPISRWVSKLAPRERHETTLASKHVNVVTH